MQVMHRSSVLGQSLKNSTPTTSTAITTTIDTTSSTAPISKILWPASTPASHDSPLTSIPLYIKRGHKYHVVSACVNCKKAHLACDVSRPCNRCVLLEKTDTCLDVRHKKRGRPKLPPKKPKTSELATIITDVYNSKPMDHHTTTTQSKSWNRIPSETFQKSHQDVNYLESLQVTQLTPSPPNPSAVQMNRVIVNQHDASSNTTLSLSSSPETKITFILSMELCCARVSDDITMAWGYYPQELAHRSMYDFIAAQGTARLSQLHRRLLDNVMEAASLHHGPARHHQAPPPTERTTSDLFHQKTIKELSIKINDSDTFVDSLHVKTRSIPNELYDVCAYLGGGLGADLKDVSTLTKLYIVMTCQKKIIDKVEQDQQQQPCKQPPSACSFEQTRRPPYKPILPLLAPAPVPSASSSSTTSDISQSRTTLSPSSNRYTAYRNRPIQPKPHDLRQVSLPAHFANNSSLNTVSFRTDQTSPKINIATSSSSIPPSIIPFAYFRPIASATATISVSQPSSSPSPSATTEITIVGSPRAESEQTTLTSIANRPVSSSTKSTGPRKISTMHHPTAQYFSQTSNSKAAQPHSKSPDYHLASGSSSSSSASESRKQGMSIHSLLS